MITVFDSYVRGRYGTKLNDVQYDSFNFILNSFPENMLLSDSGVYNTDMFDLLAVLAKMLGRYRELINGMKYSHSLEELRKLILELEELEPSNTNRIILENYYNLMAKAILDLDSDDKENFGEGIIDFDGNITEEAKAYMMEKFYFFANEVSRQRFAGSKIGIAQAVRDYISYDSSVIDKAVAVDVVLKNNKDDDPQPEGIIVRLLNSTGSDYSSQFAKYLDYSAPKYGLPEDEAYFFLEESAMYELVNKYVPMATKLYIVAKGVYYTLAMTQPGLDTHRESVIPTVNYMARIALNAVKLSNNYTVRVTVTNNNSVPMTAVIEDYFQGLSTSSQTVYILAGSSYSFDRINSSEIARDFYVSAYFQTISSDVRSAVVLDVQPSLIAGL